MRFWTGTLCAVLLLAPAACESDSSKTGSESAQKTIDGPAGNVVELSGEVTATRAGDKRTLEVGDDVFGDDVVETADGAEVAVVLAHNNARWSLTGGQKRRVDESAAWRAEKQTGTQLASNEENRTAAAGRHTEREAAGTAETAMAETPDSDDEAPGGPAPKPAAAAAPAPPSQNNSAPRRPESRRRQNKKSGSGMGSSGTGEGGGSSGEGIGLGSIGTIGKGGGGGSGQGYGAGSGKGGRTKSKQVPKVRQGSSKVSGSLDKDIIRRVVRRYLARFRHCYETELTKNEKLEGRVTVKFTIGADGNVASASAKGVNDEVSSCVARAARAMKFPKPKGGGTVSVSYPLSFTPQ